MSQTEKNLHILEAVRSGKISPADALAQLNADSPGQTGFADLGFARIDLDRKRRCGHAEVIFGQGKTPEWIIGGARRLHESQQSCLVTRVPEEAVAKICQALPQGEYDQTGRTFWLKAPGTQPVPKGRVLVLTAGTSDLPVAHEARNTALALGTTCKMVADVGVAGLHRLLAKCGGRFGVLPGFRGSNQYRLWCRIRRGRCPFDHAQRLLSRRRSCEYRCRLQGWVSGGNGGP